MCIKIGGQRGRSSPSPPAYGHPSRPDILGVDEKARVDIPPTAAPTSLAWMKNSVLIFPRSRPDILGVDTKSRVEYSPEVVGAGLVPARPPKPQKSTDSKDFKEKKSHGPHSP